MNSSIALKIFLHTKKDFKDNNNKNYCMNIPKLYC